MFHVPTLFQMRGKFVGIRKLARIWIVFFRVLCYIFHQNFMENLWNFFLEIFIVNMLPIALSNVLRELNSPLMPIGPRKLILIFPVIFCQPVNLSFVRASSPLTQKDKIPEYTKSTKIPIKNEICILNFLQNQFTKYSKRIFLLKTIKYLKIHVLNLNGT